MTRCMVGLGVAAALLWAASSASATVILDGNAQVLANTGLFTYGYAQVAAGAPVVTATISGTSYNLSMDFSPTTGAGLYDGIGAGYNSPIAALPPAPASLNDVTFSVDLTTTGLISDAGYNLQFIVQAPDGTTGPINGSPDQLLEVHVPITLSSSVSGVQHFSGDMSMGTVTGGSLATWQTYSSAADFNSLHVAGDFGNPGPYGQVAGATLDINNLVVSVVPEPASLSLLGLGALALLRRRP